MLISKFNSLCKSLGKKFDLNTATKYFSTKNRIETPFQQIKTYSNTLQKTKKIGKEEKQVKNHFVGNFQDQWKLSQQNTTTNLKLQNQFNLQIDSTKSQKRSQLQNQIRKFINIPNTQNKIYWESVPSQFEHILKQSSFDPKQLIEIAFLISIAIPKINKTDPILSLNLLLPLIHLQLIKYLKNEQHFQQFDLSQVSKLFIIFSSFTSVNQDHLNLIFKRILSNQQKLISKDVILILESIKKIKLNEAVLHQDDFVEIFQNQITKNIMRNWISNLIKSARETDLANICSLTSVLYPQDNKGLWKQLQDQLMTIDLSVLQDFKLLSKIAFSFSTTKNGSQFLFQKLANVFLKIIEKKIIYNPYQFYSLLIAFMYPGYTQSHVISPSHPGFHHLLSYYSIILDSIKPFYYVTMLQFLYFIGYQPEKGSNQQKLIENIFQQIYNNFDVIPVSTTELAYRIRLMTFYQTLVPIKLIKKIETSFNSITSETILQTDSKILGNLTVGLFQMNLILIENLANPMKIRNLYQDCFLVYLDQELRQIYLNLEKMKFDRSYFDLLLIFEASGFTVIPEMIIGPYTMDLFLPLWTEQSTDLSRQVNSKQYVDLVQNSSSYKRKVVVQNFLEYAWQHQDRGLIIEIQGAHHFIGNSQNIQGGTQIKKEIFADLLKYRYVTINNDELYQIAGFESLDERLTQLLQNINQKLTQQLI